MDVVGMGPAAPDQSNANLRWSGWLTCGAVISKIFEGVKIWIAEKICRPGFMYSGVLWKTCT
jgi:hypothetical protein